MVHVPRVCLSHIALPCLLLHSSLSLSSHSGLLSLLYLSLSRYSGFPPLPQVFIFSCFCRPLFSPNSSEERKNPPTISPNHPFLCAETILDLKSLRYAWVSMLAVFEESRIRSLFGENIDALLP